MQDTTTTLSREEKQTRLKALAADTKDWRVRCLLETLAKNGIARADFNYGPQTAYKAVESPSTLMLATLLADGLIFRTLRTDQDILSGYVDATDVKRDGYEVVA